jgi:hypothetical protein
VATYIGWLYPQIFMFTSTKYAAICASKFVSIALELALRVALAGIGVYQKLVGANTVVVAKGELVLLTIRLMLVVA